MREPKEQVDLTEIFDAIEFPDAYKISYLANAIIIPTYEDVLQTFGLLRVEYHLLMCLAHYPTLAAQDVARMTRMPRNSVSRAVMRMDQEGFLTRTPDVVDKRKSKLKITPEGRAIHDQIARWFARREREVLGSLSTSERKRFQDLLSKLVMSAASLDR